MFNISTKLRKVETIEEIRDYFLSTNLNYLLLKISFLLQSLISIILPIIIS